MAYIYRLYSFVHCLREKNEQANWNIGVDMYAFRPQFTFRVIDIVKEGRWSFLPQGTRFVRCSGLFHQMKVLEIWNHILLWACGLNKIWWCHRAAINSVPHTYAQTISLIFEQCVSMVGSQIWEAHGTIRHWQCCHSFPSHQSSCLSSTMISYFLPDGWRRYWIALGQELMLVQHFHLMIIFLLTITFGNQLPNF